jgi:hypothetical protein
MIDVSKIGRYNAPDAPTRAKGTPMQIAMIFQPPVELYSRSTYDRIQRKLAERGLEFPGKGNLYHACAVDEAGALTIFDIFESDEAINALVDLHTPIYEELAIDLEALGEYVTYLDVHNLIASAVPTAVAPPADESSTVL